LSEIHPYDTPEIITLPIQNGSKDYLDWISESVES
jgi:periplasmic divalent cation tolerance protein